MSVRQSGPGRKPAANEWGIEGVLTDLDGTLTETERVLYKAWVVLCERAGADFRQMPYSRIIGLPDVECTRLVSEHFKLDRDPAAWFEEYKELSLGMMDADLELRPGVYEFLDTVGSLKVPLVLVTSALREHALKALTKFDLVGEFAHIVTADTEGLTARKPKPDPYLLGARLIGANPRRCVAFEDSPTGVTAALAAGCFVHGIPHSHSLQVGLSQADRILWTIDCFDPARVRFR